MLTTGGGFAIPQVFNAALKMENNVIVKGYTLGLWWLFWAYIIFLVTLIAFYIFPYIKKGTRV